VLGAGVGEGKPLHCAKLRHGSPSGTIPVEAASGMSRDILIGKSAHEYFRDLVTGALAHRRFKVQEVTEFYLVNLLAHFLERERLFAVRPGGAAEVEPLALTLLGALSAHSERRYQGLKRLGDTALFVSGFFGDSLARTSVDVDYYIAMGERAYGALSEAQRRPAGMAAVFGELADRFEAFVDLYAEIAELSDLRSNRGLVKLYGRFLATGSERVAERLRERGVALFAHPFAARKGLKH
jgi:hypothetical protein